MHSLSCALDQHHHNAILAPYYQCKMRFLFSIVLLMHILSIVAVPHPLKQAKIVRRGDDTILDHRPSTLHSGPWPLATQSKRYHGPSIPCPSPTPSKHHSPSMRYSGPSMRYPGPSKHYPGPSKHYPGPSKHYPSPSKHYPSPSKHYPSPSKHYSAAPTTTPCDPTAIPPSE